MIRLLFIALIIVLIICAFKPRKGVIEGFENSSTEWTTDGYNIILNGDTGNPFTVKGINYSPTPLGENINWPPYGDYFSQMVIPKEMLDVTKMEEIELYNIRNKNIWERDLPLLKNMNVNCIRTYMVLPVADIKYPIGNTSDIKNSHTEFLDMCHENGIYVWIAYPISNSLFTEDPPKGPGKQTGIDNRTRATQGITDLVNEIGDHPAVMGFVIGNEIDSPEVMPLSEYWPFLDGLGEIVKNNTKKLTMMAFHDDSNSGTDSSNMAYCTNTPSQQINMSIAYATNLYKSCPHIDIWGINTYRGTDKTAMTDLFKNFKMATDGTCNANAVPKPLLLTEYGTPGSTRLNPLIDPTNPNQDQFCRVKNPVPDDQNPPADYGNFMGCLCSDMSCTDTNNDTQWGNIGKYGGWQTYQKINYLATEYAKTQNNFNDACTNILSYVNTLGECSSNPVNNMTFEVVSADDRKVDKFEKGIGVAGSPVDSSGNLMDCNDLPTLQYCSNLQDPNIVELDDNPDNSTTNPKQSQGDYLQTIWSYITDTDVNPGVCQGGFIFEFNDEWAKSQGDNGFQMVHDGRYSADTSGNNTFSGGYDDEEWFGLFRYDTDNFDPTDIRTATPLIPRKAVDTVTSMYAS